MIVRIGKFVVCLLFITSPAICGIDAESSYTVSRTADIDGSISSPGGSFPLRFSQKVVFEETVEQIDNGFPKEVVRTISEAGMRTYDLQTGRMESMTLCDPGKRYRIVFDDSGIEMRDADTDYRIRDDTILEPLGTPVISPLWPDGELSPGRSWSFEGTDLTRRFGFLDARGGKIDLRVDTVRTDDKTGLRTASIKGALNTSIEFEFAILEYRADVEIDLPVDLGIPTRISYDGTLTGEFVNYDYWGQAVTMQVRAKGGAIQICTPSRDMITATGEDRQTYTNDSVEVDDQRTDSFVGPPAPSEQRNSANAVPVTVVFQRRSEPRENAFSLLIPSGWIIEGGILRIDPTAQGGPAQSVDAKLDFAIKKDRDGSVMMKWIPELMYMDMRFSPAGQMGMFPNGSNYGGMTVWPKLSAIEFLETMVIPQARPGVHDLRVIERKQLPDIAEAYRKGQQAMMPGFSLSYDAGLFTVTYEEQNVVYKETFFTAIEDFGTLIPGGWKNRSTFFARAPADEFEAWEPVAGIILNSVKLNPQWVIGEIKGQRARGETVTRVYQDINRIGREMVEHQQKTNAEIMNDAFLTLTEQEEYVNPFTNEVEVGSNQWEHRWTNPSGDIIYTNNEYYDPNTDVDLNRSDFKKTPIRKRFPQ